MNYIDLFSGIGGFALGAWMAGMKFENHFSSEIDKYCIELYKKRFPDSNYLGDITKIDFENLKEKYQGDWILTGGFPCQDISLAGKGEGINGKRSILWREYRRAIRILRPRFAIIENSSALNIRGLNTILSSLASIGYNAEWQIISAAEMGAPHLRERMYIITYPNTYRSTKSLSKYKTKFSFKNGNKRRFFANTDSKRLKKLYVSSKPETQRHTNRLANEITNTSCFGCTRRSMYFNNTRNKSKSKQKREKSWRKIIKLHRQWETQPPFFRVANGIPKRMVKLAAIGNAIVPKIALLLFLRMKELLEKE